MEIKCLESILDIVKGNAPSASCVKNILKERSSCADENRLSLKSKEFISQLNIQIPLLNYEQLNIELRASLNWEQEFRGMSKGESLGIFHWMLLQLYSQRLFDLSKELFQTAEKDFQKIERSAGYGSLCINIHKEFISNYGKAVKLIFIEMKKIEALAKSIPIISSKSSKKALCFFKEALLKSDILINEKKLLFLETLKSSSKLMKNICLAPVLSISRNQLLLDTFLVEMNVRLLINIYERSGNKEKELNITFTKKHLFHYFKPQQPRNVLDALDRRLLKL